MKLYVSSSLTTKLVTFLPVLATVLIMGCGGSNGPNVAPVSGKVTFDGKPVANINVLFTPVNVVGRQSVAKTDNDGNYKLIYTTELVGAIVDKHKVSVHYDIPEQGTVVLPIPEKYSAVKTELLFEVTAGSNVINIDLKP